MWFLCSAKEGVFWFWVALLGSRELRDYCHCLSVRGISGDSLSICDIEDPRKCSMKGL